MTYLEVISIATSMVDYKNSELIWQQSSKSNNRCDIWQLNQVLKTKGHICSIMDVYINDDNPVDDLGDWPSLFEDNSKLFNKLNSVLIAWLQEDFILDENMIQKIIRTIDDDEISFYASKYEN